MRYKHAQMTVLCVKFARVSNGEGLGGLTTLATEALDLGDDVHALDNLTEDNMLSIKPCSLHCADEKLTAIGVGARIGHRKNTRTGVLEAEILISEFLAIDGLTTPAIALSEITTLNHDCDNNHFDEVLSMRRLTRWDHSVERTALVVQRLARFAGALLRNNTVFL